MIEAAANNYCSHGTRYKLPFMTIWANKFNVSKIAIMIADSDKY
jgi:hypothetical protein